MADEFDRFLKSALEPEDRLPDRGFVANVQARIALEERLAGERRALLAGLGKQLIALIAVAAAAWVIGRADPISEWFSHSPELGLTVLLAGFGSLVALIGLRSGFDAGEGRFAALRTLNGD